MIINPQIHRMMLSKIAGGNLASSQLSSVRYFSPMIILYLFYITGPYIISW